MTRTLVKAGTVVSSTGAGPLDVLVDGEQVAALISPGSTALGLSRPAVLEAAGHGRYVRRGLSQYLL